MDTESKKGDRKICDGQKAADENGRSEHCKSCQWTFRGHATKEILAVARRVSRGRRQEREACNSLFAVSAEGWRVLQKTD